MPKVLPSHVVEAIDSPLRRESERNRRARAQLMSTAPRFTRCSLSSTKVPGELIDFRSSEYLEFTRCRAVLATSLVRWNLGDIVPARDVGG